MPPNWDSWGKIRVLGGSFEAELVSHGWSEDILNPVPLTLDALKAARQSGEREDSAIARYEDWCQDPTTGGLGVVESAMSHSEAITVKSDDTQEFFESQLKILEHFKAKVLPERIGAYDVVERAAGGKGSSREEGVSEHIGPVQFNVGGIHVDADDMLQRIKVCSPLSLFLSFPISGHVGQTDTITGPQCIHHARDRGRVRG